MQNIISFLYEEDFNLSIPSSILSAQIIENVRQLTDATSDHSLSVSELEDECSALEICQKLLAVSFRPQIELINQLIEEAGDRESCSEDQRQIVATMPNEIGNQDIEVDSLFAELLAY